MSEANTAPRVKLFSGWIEGRFRDSVADLSGGGATPLSIFRGIPYAAAPLGERRWSAPEAVTAWAGLRPCIEFGPVAPQASSDAPGGYIGDLDCLSLNVWAPSPERGPYPVMVWIPGGGFMRGGASDPLYDGSAMARRGIVFVSVQYRIGVDGFMHFDDAAPNRGLQDQLAALVWVQQHIALFGGDPNRVTLAGVSAGAGGIAHLMGLRQSSGLFDRVILQSPSLQSHDPGEARLIREALAGVLGVAPTRHAISGVPLHALAKALFSFLGNDDLKRRWGLRPKNYFPVRPVIDGERLTTEPLQAIEESLSRGGPRRSVLLGCNAEEMRFYLVPSGEIDRVDEARVREFLADINWHGDLADSHLGATPNVSWGDRLSVIQSDYYYRRPTAALADILRIHGCPVWRYEFAWRSPLYGGRMGAAHAMEIAFALGNTKSERARHFIGCKAPEVLALEMHDAWTGFVKGEDSSLWDKTDGRPQIFE